jgi:hypothetical protein
VIFESKIGMFSRIVAVWQYMEKSCKHQSQCSGAMQGNAIALEMLFNAVTPTKFGSFQGGV